MKTLCKLISDSEIEPVTIEEVYDHVSSDEDHSVYLTALIKRARKRFEDYTGRILVAQTWQFAFPKFSNDLVIPKSPLQSVSSLKYIDNQAQLVAVENSDYRVIEHGLTALLQPSLGGCWPYPGYKVADAVQVECVLGHAPVVNSAIDTQNIVDPAKYELAKQALLILIADWFRNREDTAPVQLHSLPNAFKALCDELSVSLL